MLIFLFVLLLGAFCNRIHPSRPPCKANVDHANFPTLNRGTNTGYRQVPDSLGRLTRLRSLRLEENPHLRGPIPATLASRPDCDVRADELVTEDTEATMLGSKLDDWFLMPRKARQQPIRIIRQTRDRPKTNDYGWGEVLCRAGPFEKFIEEVQ